MSSIIEKYNAGEYKATVPYPVRKRGHATNRDKAKRDEALKEYRKSEQAGVERFWADVREEYGMKADDPFVQEMQKIAWEMGHGSGLGEVYNYFQELYRLYKLYEKKL